MLIATSLDENQLPIWQYLWQDKESENSECQLCKEKGVSKIIYTKTVLDHLKHMHAISGNSTKASDVHSLLHMKLK